MPGAANMPVRRSIGKMHVARSLWYVRPGVVEIRSAPLPPPSPNQARVRTLFSGISRGTERLVLAGAVPVSEWQRMRAPLQQGDFPFPVKYGYCAAGVVEDGPPEIVGQRVFCLHPHQDMFVAPIDRLIAIPEGVPERRATLAANMETALNAHWDAATGPGDRIVVVGAGVVGLAVAHLAARLPGAEVTVVDISPARRPAVEAIGARFATPDATPADADIVFHASASAEGLATALGACGFEGTVVELSWYGDKPIAVPLGDVFHSRRLRLISSQVGKVSPSRRERWDYRRRLEAALSLLADPALDALIPGDITFEDAPTGLPGILGGNAGALAPLIRYPSP
jgi:threonine dehydrogenase-like Zn-dependent dehydrogenase